MKGQSALLRQLETEKRRLLRAAQEARDEAARESARRAAAAAPVRTGALQRSLTAGEGRVSSSLPYAGIQERKTGFLSAAAEGEAYVKTAKEKYKQGG